MNAFPMFVLSLNNLVTMKIIIVEITRPITKMTAGLSISNDAIMIQISMKKINSCIESHHNQIQRLDMNNDNIKFCARSPQRLPNVINGIKRW